MWNKETLIRRVIRCENEERANDICGRLEDFNAEVEYISDPGPYRTHWMVRFKANNHDMKIIVKLLKLENCSCGRNKSISRMYWKES